jgi:glycosyltransferase involved in cell wall biosynthesis
MIKVAAITSGRNVPSSRFRVRQFITPLAELGIEVTEHYARPNKYLTRRVWPLGLLTRLPGLLASRSADITWLEREMVPGRLTAERFTGGVRILDIDDAIWITNQPGASEQLAAQCGGIIAGNEYIAEHYRQHAQRVWVIPTSVDTDRWRPRDSIRHLNKDRWNIGWIGTSSNLPFLQICEEPLADFLSEHPAARLTVVCDRPPSLKKIPPASLQFKRWSEQDEVRLVQDFDVGIMPLPDTDWARGKCALKMLQYMSVGIPAIASQVGRARDILEQSEVGVAVETMQGWYDGMTTVYHDRALTARMGEAGRALILDSYSVEKNVIKLAEVFRAVL